MKFSVERDNLLHALQHANRIVTKGDTIPILSSALFKVEGGRIAIAATNTEMVAQTGCAADIETGGAAAIRVSLLADILRKLPAGTPLRFERDETTGQMVMHYRRSRAVLPTLSADDFAMFDLSGDAVEVQVEAAALARLLSVPAWASKADAGHLYACGIHLHYAEVEDLLIGIAVNGIVLSRVAMPCAAARALRPITIPHRSCGEFVKLLQAVGGGSVTLRASERVVSIEGDGTVLTSKLIECQYPDYQRAVPADPKPIATVSAADLSSALDRVQLLARDEQHQTVVFRAAGGELTVSASSPTGGEITEHVEIDGGQGLAFGCRAKFAIDALNSLDSDVVCVAGGEYGAPVVIRPVQGGGSYAMLMPQRV